MTSCTSQPHDLEATGLTVEIEQLVRECLRRIADLLCKLDKIEARLKREAAEMFGEESLEDRRKPGSLGHHGFEPARRGGSHHFAQTLASAITSGKDQRGVLLHVDHQYLRAPTGAMSRAGIERYAVDREALATFEIDVDDELGPDVMNLAIRPAVHPLECSHENILRDIRFGCGSIRHRTPICLAHHCPAGSNPIFAELASRQIAQSPLGITILV